MRVGIVVWIGETHCVTPWLDHGVQKYNLKLNNFSIFYWIPRSSRGMTARTRSTQQYFLAMTEALFFTYLKTY
ncbi:hypothetical protein [Rickettsia tamurae]|uniref:hypothetical protein n=1 Tax=Rickettsia tamurae TaxID=334545 RepID=UPI000A072A07|nr:hypothetical protein [Rickettsia tamurae]